MNILKSLYSSTVEHNTVNIRINVRFILRANKNQYMKYNIINTILKILFKRVVGEVYPVLLEIKYRLVLSLVRIQYPLFKPNYIKGKIFYRNIFYI
jgi:hypothetical protein